MRISRLVPVLALLALLAAPLHAQPRRRALLIGINDYTASTLAPAGRGTPVPGRDWPSLGGAVNDVHVMEEMLVHAYGFERRDIVELTDQQATRGAILQAIDAQLVQSAAAGDVLLFYYSGHGSQVRNWQSDEQDKFDESIIPADSKLGAKDIRDKELRLRFNGVLDHGARLTVILDSCHSGSGTRGLDGGAQSRGVRFDPRDVADGSDAGPRPEDRGALVISAAEDRELAWETRNGDGQLHGAFSWAWFRAMKDAAQDEPAWETFLRAQARLRGETPYQSPVLAGTPEARQRPFLGSRTDRRDDRTVVAVERVRADGTVILQGGWANGLTVGSELRTVTGDGRLIVTAIHGVGESEARPDPAARALAGKPEPGTLLEVAGWALPSTPPMRVWMPRHAATTTDLAALAKTLASAAQRNGVEWLTDPLRGTPDHLLRWRDGEWELAGDRESLRKFGPDGVMTALGTVPRGSSLFVQFPASTALVEQISLGGTRIAIDTVNGPAGADYILTGRFAGQRLEYAWVRPGVQQSDRRRTAVPLQTDWHSASDATVAGPDLRLRVETLRKIRSWNLLASPPAARSPYHLALRRSSDGHLLGDGTTAGGEHYRFFLQLPSGVTAKQLQPRYVYVFAIDSAGKSVLLFPRDAGSVENRLPVADPAGLPVPSPSSEILLDKTAQFEVTPPYGIDTYFLLTTAQRLPNPGILAWDGVRDRPGAETPLEELIAQAASGTRSPGPAVPADWSLEKVVCESVARREPAGRSSR